MSIISCALVTMLKVAEVTVQAAACRWLLHPRGPFQHHMQNDSHLVIERDARPHEKTRRDVLDTMPSCLHTEWQKNIVQSLFQR